MALRSASRRAAVAAVALLTGAVTYAATAPDRVTDRAAASALLAAPGSPGSPGPVRSQEGATASPAAQRLATRSATPAPAPRQSPRPTRLRIPALSADLRVAPAGVDARGRMAIPEDPGVAGWYRFGPRPGDPAGATVIAAHVDGDGRVGPLAGLRSLTPGDRFVVTTGSTTVSYAVVRVNRYDKDSLDLAALFSRTGPPRLHLVSCGGAFDRATGHYEDNVVAVATPVAP